MITAPPRLFDAKGNFQENVDLTGLDPKMVTLAETVRTESRAVKAAEQVFADACAELSASEKSVTVTKEYHDAHFPPQTFHDLWRENFGRK
jgi:hypothetical protein